MTKNGNWAKKTSTGQQFKNYKGQRKRVLFKGVKQAKYLGGKSKKPLTPAIGVVMPKPQVSSKFSSY